MNRPECIVCVSGCGWYYPTERAASRNEVIRCPKCNSPERPVVRPTERADLR